MDQITLFLQCFQKDTSIFTSMILLRLQETVFNFCAEMYMHRLELTFPNVHILKPFSEPKTEHIQVFLLVMYTLKLLELFCSCITSLKHSTNCENVGISKGRCILSRSWKVKMGSFFEKQGYINIIFNSYLIITGNQ